MPINPHVNFIQFTIDHELGQESKAYLEKKETALVDEWEQVEGVSGFYLARQAAHIFSLPATLIGLVVQTVADTIIVAGVALGTLVTFGLNQNIRFELKARTYNLLVADTAAWLSLIPSLFVAQAYVGANSLHLGTVRKIQSIETFRELELEKKRELEYQTLKPSAPLL